MERLAKFPIFTASPKNATINLMKIFAKKNNTIPISIINILFGCLIIFEILNFISLLHVRVQFTWLGLIITASATWIFLAIISKHYAQKKGVPLPWQIWLIAFAAVTSDAAGDMLHLYARFFWWDQFVHFSVSGIQCFTLFIISNAFWIDEFKFSLLMKKGRFALSLLIAVASSMAFGALYEIEEYVEDLLFKTNRLGPGTDTANDLLMNFLGIMLVASLIIIHYRITRRRKILD